MLKKHFLALTLLLLLVTCRAFFAEDIVTRSLNDYDEARYAEVARNIVRTGNWLIPMAGGPDEPRNLRLVRLANGESLYPYFWKPPLHTILIAISYNIFGISELAVRLPSLIFALFCAVLTHFITLRLLGGKHIYAFVATLIFVSTSDFSFLSSQGVAEMQHLAFALLAIWVVGTQYKYEWFLSGVALGLSIMTKSIASFWVLPVAYLYSILIKNKSTWREMIAQLVLGATMTALLWHAYMLARFGDLFVERYLLVNLLGRATGIQMNVAPVYWYLTNLARGYMLLLIPSFLSFMIVLSRHLGEFARQRHPGSGIRATLQAIWSKPAIFLAFWILVVLIPFSLIKSKVWWYVFPIWTPLAIMISWGTSELVSYLKALKNGISRSISMGVFGLVALGIFLTAFQSVMVASNRNFGTGATKILASRNKALTGLSVFGVPYESALFYFGTGNVSFDIAKSRYVLALKTSEQGILDLGFVRIDGEGGWGLWGRQ